MRPVVSSISARGYRSVSIQGALALSYSLGLETSGTRKPQSGGHLPGLSEPGIMACRKEAVG